MRRSLLALCAAVTILAGACGSTHKTSAPPTTPVATAPIPSSTTRPPSTTPPSSADPTTTTTVAPTTTTTVPDTSVVPRRITVAYVDAVLAKLNHVYGDAVRSTVAHKRLTEAAYRELAAIYTPSLAAEEQKIFIEDVGQGLKGIKAHPGDRVMHVTDLISTNASCVYGKVRTSFRAVDTHAGPPPAVEYFGLNRQSPASNAPRLNPTPWIFFFDITYGRYTKLANQCAGK